METNSTDSCPRCGAKSNELREPSWECGSFHSLTTYHEYHTDLCAERAEHNRLKRDHEDTLELLDRRNNELAAAKLQNKEDLSKLTEAVELGSKQAEVFDELYTKVHRIASNAIESLEICHKAKIIPTQYYEKYRSELLELPNP
jgi:hypothetical protein